MTYKVYGPELADIAEEGKRPSASAGRTHNFSRGYLQQCVCVKRIKNHIQRRNAL